jgi:O-antigen/teichoic acid export membrane protein
LSAPGRPADGEPVRALDAVEAAIEGVPGAVSLAPGSPVPALGGGLLLPARPDPGGSVPARVDPGSVRAGLVQAGPLALAGLVVNGANVVVTIILARLLSTRGYGQLAQLTGLFLIISMPGSALVVAVVRRVTAWRAEGQGHRVVDWSRRLHGQGVLAVLAFAVITVAVGPAAARALGQHHPVGVEAMAVAGAVWVLLSFDRGLLQAHRNYRDLAGNIVLEGASRTVGMLVLGAAFGVIGVTVGFLCAEVITAVQVRVRADRTWAAEAGCPEPGPGAGRPGRLGPVWTALTGGLRRGRRVGGSAPWTAERRTVVHDLLAALGAMALLALLQNIDVIVFGRFSPHLSGSYAAVSVSCKAIVFGAIALGGYLLPEAAIRWHEGGHALRQLAVTLLLLAVPALGLVVVALFYPHLVFTLVFSARYLGAQSAFAPLVLAMIALSVTVVLTMYLLAVGCRWVTAVLAVGGVAATVAMVQANGVPRATARADLVVQLALVVAVAGLFVLVHRKRWRSG